MLHDDFVPPPLEEGDSIFFTFIDIIPYLCIPNNISITFIIYHTTSPLLSKHLANH